jgi:hypothetical protein
MLQVIGPTMGYREFGVLKSMKEATIDWVNKVEVDMLKYMSTEAGGGGFFTVMKHMLLQTNQSGSQILLKIQQKR